MVLFAEDPGAANYLAPLPLALRLAGHEVQLYATGPAVDYLTSNSVDFEHYAHNLPMGDGEPALLIVGTSENRSTPAFENILVAKKLGITTVGVVDHFANASYRFRGLTDDPLAYAPNHILVPDNSTLQEFVRLGFPKQRIHLCGHPHYDEVRTRFAALERKGRQQIRKEVLPVAGFDKQVMVFVAEISRGYEANAFKLAPDYTLRGTGEWNDRTTIVMEELLLGLKQTRRDPYLVLRLHPKNKLADFGRLAEEFDFLSEGGSPLPLVYAADQIVGMTSMLMLEAALMLRPTLAVLPRRTESNWLPTISAGITDFASTREELVKALAASLPPSKKLRPQVEALFPRNSTRHVVAVLTQIAMSSLA